MRGAQRERESRAYVQFERKRSMGGSIELCEVATFGFS